MDAATKLRRKSKRMHVSPTKMLNERKDACISPVSVPLEMASFPAGPHSPAATSRRGFKL